MTAPPDEATTGEVVHLRKQQPATADDDPEVLEGPVVDVDDDDDPQPGGVLATIDDLLHSDTAYTIAQHTGYVVVGANVTHRRWRELRRPEIVYQRYAQLAMEAGDHETGARWAELAQSAIISRHQRRHDRADRRARAVADFPLKAKVTGGIYAGAGVILAIATGDTANVVTPVLLTADIIMAIIHVAAVTWLPALITAPFLALGGLWALGRANVDSTHIEWVRALTASDTDGDPITPSIVVTALRDLGIPTLRKAIEAMPDNGASMLSPIAIAGLGVEFDVTLPSGVSTEEVMNRRRKLAENLGRHEHELYLTVAPAARTVRLWAADSGALDEPVGESPLVTDPNMRADYRTGRAPWGRTLRGDLATISLFQNHVIITGTSNQGKTAAARALALWLAFDPSVRFHIADLKGIGDWAMFDGIAEVLIQGPSDAHVIATTEMVEEAVEEMNRRLTAVENGTVPPGGYDPYVVIVDEAQKAYMCPAVGPDGRPYGGTKFTSRYFNAVRAIRNQGRAVDVMMQEYSQDPTNQNFPKLNREGSHLRACLVIGTESQARMALGEAPVDAGAAPHKLRQGLDKGTVVACGEAVDIPRGEPALTIRTFFVDTGPAHEVADQAKARRKAVATRSQRVERQEPRNLLADLDEVLLGRAENVRLAHVPPLLEELAPGYTEYEGMTGVQLRKLLEHHGMGDAITTTGNVPQVKPEEFRRVFKAMATAWPEKR